MQSSSSLMNRDFSPHKPYDGGFFYRRVAERGRKDDKSLCGGEKEKKAINVEQMRHGIQAQDLRLCVIITFNIFGFQVK